MRKILFYSCFYGFFFAGIVMLTVGSVLPDLRAAYNLNDAMSGAVLSCYSLGNLASGIISSLAAIYLGQKAALIIMTFAVISGIWLSQCGSFMTLWPGLLFVSCALIGLGRGSLITLSQRIVISLTAGNPRTTVMLHASFAAGAILAPLMFSLLRIISWKAGLILVAVLGLVAVLLFAFASDYPDIRKSSHVQSGLGFLRERGFMLIACMMFLYLCCEFALNGWLVTYMTHKNMSMNFAQSMASLLWLVMLIGRLICAWLSKYISQARLLLFSSLGSAIFFVYMLLSSGRVNIAISVACVGFFMSGISPIIYASSAPYTNRYALAMGVLFSIGCLGGTLMPLITGMIAQLYGFDAGIAAIGFTFMLLVVFTFMNLKRR